jgi:signal transduction histidine kinase/DNA invertase Pin-like site-specific DNA recombinase
MKASSTKSVRCAIYTRVSTEHGLDQEFNSLDAQYEAASAYIKSQAHAGWTLIRSRYDDGGYSGGSTDRPDLQKLLDDIRARKVDVIVVYKVDRLTRSLADFAKLVELFDSHGVSFVSVTQQFNTTTSMGRLTLNVLLSFAQFEREVTSERIRDKVAASKRKGLWVGGNLPLGYEMKDGKIAVVEEEAELVRSIFRRYLELGSVNELLRDLKERNIRTKTRQLSTGKTRGGIPFGRGTLYYVLSNHFYIGEVKYKGEILPGEQPPIMDRALFEAVRQKSLAQWSHRTVLRNKSDHFLAGLLFDDAGHRMIPAITGSRSPANAAERRDADDGLLFTALVVIKATDRRRYERQLLDSRSELQKGLATERETSELREQFIAVLGHDLRNPLAAISAGARILQRSGALREHKELRVLDMINTTVTRMSDLIDDVLDFARGRLGGGITLNRDANSPLEPVLEQVVDELRTASARRVIETSFEITEPINCDRTRIGQLVSNLIGNALTHGAPDQPVRVGAKTERGELTLWVANAGEPIPPAAMEKLFEPFFRGDVRDSRQGLGLGLHIASQIAQAHGGRIDVTSTPDETRFVFAMPLKSAASR